MNVANDNDPYAPRCAVLYPHDTLLGDIRRVSGATGLDPMLVRESLLLYEQWEMQAHPEDAFVSGVGLIQGVLGLVARHSRTDTRMLQSET